MAPAVAIQSIRKCPAMVAMDAPSISFKRHGMLASTRDKFDQQLMTDVTIVVGARSWGVHRADLSMASPVLRFAFEMEVNTGVYE